MATFGKTTQGASNQFTANAICCKFTAPENGTITSISVYAGHFGVNFDVGVAIYADASGDPGAKLAEDSGNVTVTTSGFVTLTISQAITSGTVYWLAMWFSTNDGAYYYDAGTTGQLRDDTGLTFETWPGTFGSDFSFDREMSIYATYTPSGGQIVGPGVRFARGKRPSKMRRAA